MDAVSRTLPKQLKRLLYDSNLRGDLNYVMYVNQHAVQYSPTFDSM